MYTNNENINKQIDELKIQKEQLEKQISKLEYEANRKHPNNDVDNFLRGYSGKELMKKHNLSDFGKWEILGEDPNCDFAGTHTQPHIAYVEGTLEEAIKYAVKQPRWETWGGGGTIKPIDEKLIIKL